MPQDCPPLTKIWIFINGGGKHGIRELATPGFETSVTVSSVTTKLWIRLLLYYLFPCHCVICQMCLHNFSNNYFKHHLALGLQPNFGHSKKMGVG